MPRQENEKFYHTLDRPTIDRLLADAEQILQDFAIQSSLSLASCQRQRIARQQLYGMNWLLQRLKDKWQGGQRY